MSYLLENKRKRYAKVLNDYPELKETSNLLGIDAYAGSDEQKLQQVITAALICDDPSTYNERNVMRYLLETCNTPTDHNYHSDSPVSFRLMRLLKNRYSTPLYKIEVEDLEQIYFIP